MSVETPGGMVMLWVISKPLPVIAGLVSGSGSGFGSGSGNGSSSPGAMVMSFSTTSHVASIWMSTFPISPLSP